MTKEQIIEAIKELKVSELAELVADMEEEFGVSAAVPVGGVAMPGAGGGDAGAAEKDEFEVVLKEVGSEKIKVIKVVREQTGLGLKEAKEIVDNAPKTIKESVSKEDADKIVEAFKAVGATIELK